MVMPDFEEWANTVKLSRFADAIQTALKEAFEQGRHLGKQQQELLWWEEQDRCLGNEPQLLSRELHDRIDSLVKGVEFDINLPLPSCLGSTACFNRRPYK